ncbi:MAG: hypothetical protein Fur0037_14290 [Planctomycetota bacterium]
MGIATTSLSLLATLLPQQPQAPVAPEAAAHALLPEDAILALSVGDLAAIPPPAPGAPAASLWSTDARLMARGALQGLGLRGQAFDQAWSWASRGFALAWTGFESDGSPGIVLVTRAGVEDPPELPFLRGARRRIVAGHAVFATHERLLPAAMAPDGGPLADRDLASPRAGSALVLAKLFVRTNALVAMALDRLPEPDRAKARTATRALGLDDLGPLQTRWTLGESGIVATTRIPLLATGGVIGLLFGRPGSIGPDLARLVPREATGFSAAAIDLGEVASGILDAISNAQPEMARQIEAGISSLKSAMGLDVRGDILENLGGVALFVTMPGDPADSVAASFEIADPSRMERALDAIARAAPVTRDMIAGKKTWTLAELGGNEIVASVAGGRLILASDRKALGQLIATSERPEANPEAVSFLRGLPASTTWAGRGRPAGAWRTLAREIGRSAGEAQDAPVTWFRCERDENGVVLRASSVLAQIAEIAASRAPNSTETNPPLAAPEPPLTASNPAAAPSGQPGGESPAPALGASAVPSDGADPPAAPSGETQVPGTPDPGEVRALAEAERGKDLDPERIASLLRSSHHSVAARAAWLVGRKKARNCLPALCETASKTGDETVLLHCMAALDEMPSKAALGAALRGLGASDVRVRAIAARLLGKIGSTAAVEPLVALVDERVKEGNWSDSPDVVAAIASLSDLGTPSLLLPLASAIPADDPAVGQALAFLFQRLSPTMAAGEEAVLLMATLDHPCRALRRYSVQRLGELRNPAASRALEARLAAEDPEMQKIVEVALAATQRPQVPSENDLWNKARTNAQALWGMARTRWEAMDSSRRLPLAGCAALGLIALLGVLRMQARARRIAREEEAAALVAASPEWLEQEQGYAAMDPSDPES